MKTKFLIVIGLAGLAACNNSETAENLRVVANRNASLLSEAQKKDSTITADVNTIAEIQDNLDSIKRREKILTVNTDEYKPGSEAALMTDIKSIDDFILSNDRKLNELEAKVKTLGGKDIHLEKLVKNLNAQLAEKDEEVTALQDKLSKTSDSLKFVTHRFNDSMAVIRQQRAQVYALTEEVNTVYYLTGTMKELKDKGAIDKEGGFIGLGRTSELNPNLVNASFNKAAKISLSSIPLNGKFRRLITLHPDDSYKISRNGNTDELVITNPSLFWKESKYLVVAVK